MCLESIHIAMVLFLHGLKLLCHCGFLSSATLELLFHSGFFSGGAPKLLCHCGFLSGALLKLLFHS